VRSGSFTDAETLARCSTSARRFASSSRTSEPRRARRQGLLERRPNGQAGARAPAALQSDVLAGLRAAVARLEALERELAR
jgi:hypothetical protein